MQIWRFLSFEVFPLPYLQTPAIALLFYIICKKWIALNLDGFWSLDGWNSAKVNSNFHANCIALNWKPWSWTTEFYGRTLVFLTETILALERWMVGSNFQLNQDVKLLFADHFNSLRWLWQSNIWLLVTMRLRITT